MQAAKAGPGGRPTDYKPEYCEMLIEHMAKGFSFETFGATIRVARSTVFLWAEKHQEFSDAKKLAFDLCQLWWEEKSILNIENISETEREGNRVSTYSKSLNTGNFVFNMKNRFGWKDKLEVSGDDRAPIKLAYDARRPKSNK